MLSFMLEVLHPKLQLQSSIIASKGYQNLENDEFSEVLKTNSIDFQVSQCLSLAACGKTFEGKLDDALKRLVFTTDNPTGKSGPSCLKLGIFCFFSFNYFF